MEGLARVWKNIITAAQVPQAVHNREEFIAGALIGVIDEYQGFYDVLSYGVRIARWSHEGWSVDTRKYSATTSRHQRLVAQGIDQYRICADAVCTELYSHV
jgi:hypothetical protein